MLPEPQFPLVVASFAPRTLGEARRGVDIAPPGCSLVEVRADGLSADDVVAAVAGTDRPLIVTARHAGHGGAWSGSEAERVNLLRRALAAGARFVDVEAGTAAAALVDEAPDRAILSDHRTPCVAADLESAARALAGSAAALLKLVPHAERPGDAAAVRAALSSVAPEGRLTSFASGPGGTWTRVLCCAWGAWGSYGALTAAAATAPGQTTAAELLDVYRVTRVGAATRRFALIGSDVSGSPSPAMHAAAYRAAGIDAVYVPLSGDDLDDLMRVVDGEQALDAAGFGVTMPFKERVAGLCAAGDAVVAASGAVNTVTGRAERRVGFNTDGPAAVALLRRALDPAGARVAIAGAGGTARAIAAALTAAGAEVTIYARRPAAVAAFASGLGAACAALAELPSARWDALVNATPLGRGGEPVVPGGSLTGRIVLDAVYGPTATPLVRDARRRGLVAIDGASLLLEQALGQYEALTGRCTDRDVLGAALTQWMSSRSS